MLLSQRPDLCSSTLGAQMSCRVAPTSSLAYNWDLKPGFGPPTCSEPHCLPALARQWKHQLDLWPGRVSSSGRHAVHLQAGRVTPLCLQGVWDRPAARKLKPRWLRLFFPEDVLSVYFPLVRPLTHTGARSLPLMLALSPSAAALGQRLTPKQEFPPARKCICHEYQMV